MPVQIVLDHPNTIWTNFDQINGKVVLKLDSQSSISSIVVKLEGESRTKLLAPAPTDFERRPRPQEEFHKILYRKTTVFPPPDIANASSQRAFTLSAGNYEYPFHFRIPINNSCTEANNPTPVTLTIKNIATTRLSDIGRNQIQHVHTTLPPTITAFPGMADIRYYVKVTVNRKEFYKENPRHVHNFNFLPIEPPRPAQRHQAETYARRRHDFAAGKQTRRSLLDSIRGRPAKPTAVLDGTPPCITVDARLPNPPIITCNRDVPLRIFVKRLNQSSHALFLHSLQITLAGHTHVRAQEVLHEVVQTWVLFSRANIGTLVLPASRPEGKKGLAASMKEGTEEEVLLDLASIGWEPNKRMLPNSVAPTFETCNIRRTYELDVEIGIGWGNSASTARNHIVLPLKHQVQVYSGIQPPVALQTAPQPRVNGNKGKRRQQRPVVEQPNQAGPSHFQDTSIAEQFGASEPLSSHNEEEEAPPPSYEDVLTDNVPSVAAGGRPVYEPPTTAGGSGFGDEKRRHS